MQISTYSGYQVEDAVEIIEFTGDCIADSKAGRVLDCHPGEYHAGGLDDPEDHKEQDRQIQHELDH